MQQRRRAVMLLLVTLLALAGCDRARVQQWASFASAGTAYVALFHAFAEDAGKQAIAADSAALVTARDLAGDQVAAHRSEFAGDLQRSDTQMRVYLANLQRLQTQASLLGRYFAAITRLADSSNTTGVLAGMDAVVDALNTVNPEVETVQFAGKGVKDYLKPATALVVAHVQERALQRELQHAAPAIDRALALQEAAVTALLAQTQTAQQAASTGDERTLVLDPYLQAGPLPSGWARDRAALLQAGDDGRGANTLAAIQALRASFHDLLAGQAHPAGLGPLWRAVSAAPAPAAR